MREKIFRYLINKSTKYRIVKPVNHLINSPSLLAVAIITIVFFSYPLFRPFYNPIAWDVLGYYLYLPMAFIYHDIGIHDYSVPDIGTAIYLEDLVWLKEHGYHEADMGGGERSLTAFKNKFYPASSYLSDVFSVVNRSRS